MASISLISHLVSCLLAGALLAGCGSFGHHRRAMGEDVGGRTLRAEPAALFLAGLDGNLDTFVMPDELRGALGRLFAAADRSKDGTISVLELNDWRRHWFGSADGWPGQFHFDSDGNGVISHKEFDAGLETLFTDFDSDTDGKLDRAELLTASPGREKPEAGADAPRPPAPDRGDIPN